MSKDLPCEQCQYKDEACSYCNWIKDNPVKTRILTLQETLEAMKDKQGVYKKDKCQR